MFYIYQYVHSAEKPEEVIIQTNLLLRRKLSLKNIKKSIKTYTSTKWKSKAAFFQMGFYHNHIVDDT